MSRWTLTGLLLTAFAAPAAAAPDPESDKPYTLRVVLCVGAHHHLSPDYRADLRRTLQDSLAGSLGTMAKVEVIDRDDFPREDWPPLWREAETKGLTALAGFPQLTGVKTHFARIEFADGRYEIQSRQHDGSTGLASPVVRRASVGDRSLIARQVALQVETDFGAVGTFEAGATAQTVNVQLKGGKLDGPWARWVRPGEVFAVTRLTRPVRKADGTIEQASKPIDWTFLQATESPKDGVVPCKVVSRYETPFAAPGAGFRCMKIGTRGGQVRIQLADDKGRPYPPGDLRVLVASGSFPENDATGEKATFRDGSFQTRPERSFQNLAYARVWSGAFMVARVPVPLIDERVILCDQVKLVPGGEAVSALLLERDGCLARLNECLAVLINSVKTLTKLQERSNRDALAKAQAVYHEVEGDVGEIRDRLARLKADIQTLPEGSRFSLADREERLEALARGQDKLAKHVAELAEVVKSADSPDISEKRRKAEDLLSQARLHFAQADYDQGIELYKKMLELGDDAKHRQFLEDLEAKWKVRDADHGKARAFLYETWPKAQTAAEMSAQIAQAETSFRKCREVGDKLSPRKLEQTFPEQITKLAEEVKAVESGKEDEREAKLKVIADVTARITKLSQEVTDYLKIDAPKAEPKPKE